MLKAAKRISFHICGAGGALALAGCTSAVVVESEFPTPLVEQLPVSIGLVFEPELRDFIHAEALPRSSTWTIDLGDANLAMLRPLFEAMFATTREIEDLSPAAGNAASLDAILSSTLETFQFDVPQTTRDEFVEVWLQYRLQLVDANGLLIVDWPVKGWGKAEVYRDREEAVQRAAIVAMREAGATISTEFTEQTPVQNWLLRRSR